jgi:hypothetical protein
VLVRLDHVASIIVNASHGIVVTGAMFGVAAFGGIGDGFGGKGSGGGFGLGGVGLAGFGLLGINLSISLQHSITISRECVAVSVQAAYRT